MPCAPAKSFSFDAPLIDQLMLIFVWSQIYITFLHVSRKLLFHLAGARHSQKVEKLLKLLLDFRRSLKRSDHSSSCSESRLKLNDSSAKGANCSPDRNRFIDSEPRLINFARASLIARDFHSYFLCITFLKALKVIEKLNRSDRY